MEISNPFDAPEGQFLVLENPHQQFSLWPALCALPPGWRVVYGPYAQPQCCQWLEHHWLSLLPKTYAHYQ